MKPEDQPTGGLNVHKRRFDVMQVCPLEGSTITAWFHTHPETRAKCCPDCGAETINQCPSCGEEIRGADLTSGYLGKPDPPRCCVQCGSKFPWTERVSAHELAVTRPHQDPLRTIRTIVERFRQFALQLERRQQRRPPISIKDEYDVQDLLHAVLRLFFDDVRTEEFTPSYASAASRMDFLLKVSARPAPSGRARVGRSTGGRWRACVR